eukprot:scaffold130097_cov50-Cyclotella_meneghiniana.AAC.3
MHDERTDRLNNMMTNASFMLHIGVPKKSKLWALHIHSRDNGVTTSQIFLSPRHVGKPLHHSTVYILLALTTKT